MPMKPSVFLFILLLFSCSNINNKETAKPHPNILLIVADDLGYTDLGVYGGEIETPNIDALAANGIMFSQFHTAPVCAVTRAMMLSGNDNHIAGMGSQDLTTAVFGYEGHLTDRIIPFPVLLTQAGYHTSMAGKWHLGALENGPNQNGFEQSFALLESSANHYTNVGLFKESPVSPYAENGVMTDWPEGAYSTDFYTDKLIQYIDRNKDDGQPFFAFAAFTSPHWPLQVDSTYWRKYEGVYDEGYENLRAKRFNNQKKLGLIPNDATLPELHPDVKPWDELSAEQKKKEARKMELYAGMVDNLDNNIGRLITYLKETAQFENTLIVFMSDNGAAGNDFYHHPAFSAFLQENYTEEYDAMGTAKSFISYGPQWAEAGAAPFKYFKGYTTEGGINTPFIVSGDLVNAKGKQSDSFVTLMDLAPTFYEIAGIDYSKSINKKEVYPLKGSSLLSALENPTVKVHDDQYVFAMEHRGHIQIRKGDWKLVNSVVPLDESNFELYNLTNDTGEQQNIRNENPEKYQELLKEWKKYEGDVKVQFPTPVAGAGL